MNKEKLIKALKNAENKAAVQPQYTAWLWVLLGLAIDIVDMIPKEEIEK